MKQKYNQNTSKYTSNKKFANINLLQLSTRSMRNLFLFFIGEQLHTGFDCCKTKLHIGINHQWWSLATCFGSRDESQDPFLRVSMSVSKVSGLVSISKATGLETLNIVKNWYNKISTTQQILFVYLQLRNNQNQSENARNLKKVQLTKKKFGKMHKFRSLEFRDFWWSLGLEVLTRSRFRRLLPRLHRWSSHFCIVELTLLNAAIVA